MIWDDFSVLWLFLPTFHKLTPNIVVVEDWCEHISCEAEGLWKIGLELMIIYRSESYRKEYLNGLDWNGDGAAGIHMLSSDWYRSHTHFTGHPSSLSHLALRAIMSGGLKRCGAGKGCYWRWINCVEIVGRRDRAALSGDKDSDTFP